METLLSMTLTFVIDVYLEQRGHGEHGDAALISRAEEIISEAVQAAYTRHASGVQVMILDLPKIFKEARAALASGQDLDVAMPLIVTRYRLN